MRADTAVCMCLKSSPHLGVPPDLIAIQVGTWLNAWPPPGVLVLLCTLTDMVLNLYFMMSGYGTFDVKALTERRVPGVGPFPNGHAQIKPGGMRAGGDLRYGREYVLDGKGISGRNRKGGSRGPCDGCVCRVRSRYN